MSASVTAGIQLGLGVSASWDNGVEEVKGEVTPSGSLTIAGNAYLSSLKGTLYGKGTISIPAEVNSDGELSTKVDLTGEIGGQLNYGVNSQLAISKQFGPVHVYTPPPIDLEPYFEDAIDYVENLTEGDPLVVTNPPPTSIALGSKFGLVATARNADGSLNQSFNGDVTISNPGQNDLSGATTVQAVNGVATFSGLSLAGAGTTHHLYLSAGSDAVYTSGISVTATASSPVATGGTPGIGAAASVITPAATPSVSQFVFQGSIGSIPAAFETGTPIVTPNSTFQISVDAENASGSIVTSYNGPVTLTLAKNPSNATLGGTLTVNAVNGVATFKGLSINTEGRGFVLTTTSTTASPGASNTFDVLDYLAITKAAPSSVAAGAPFGLVVEAQDASGHLDKSFNGDVTISDSNYSGGPTNLLQGTTTVQAVNGVATFSGLALDQSGNYSVLIKGSDVVFTSQLFQVIPGPASQLVMTTEPANAVTSGSKFNVKVSAEDQYGNVVPNASGTVSISLGNDTTGATLGGTLTAKLASGVASFSNLTVDKTGTGYVLQAADSASGVSPSTSSAFNVTAPGVATRLAITNGPARSLIAGATFNPVVKEEDDLGTVDTSYNGPVTLSLASNPTAGNLSGTVTVNAVMGVATFSGLSIDTAGAYTLDASSGTLTPAALGTITVTPAAASQVVVTPTASAILTGSTFSTTVQIEDQYNNVVNVTEPVTLALAANPGGATLGGTLTVTASQGVATFSNLTVDQPGSSYTLKTTAGTLPAGVSAPFDVMNANLVVTSSPAAGVVAGAPFGLVVQAQGPSGVVDTQFNGPVSVGLIDYDGTGATLSGTLTVNANAGVATFSGLSVNDIGPFALSVTGGGANPTATGAFNVNASQLAVTTQPPARVTATAPFSVTVSAGDANGNVDPHYNGPVTIALANNPSGATLGGTLTVMAVDGLATFTGLTLDKTGSGETLQTTATSLTSAVTSTLAVLPAGTATQIVVTTEPASSLTAGSPFGLVVKAEDTFGNVITSYQGSVTLSDDEIDLAGILSVPVSNGVATFSGLTINQTWPSEMLSVGAPNLDGASVGPVSISPGPIAQLAVSTSNSTIVAGLPFDVEVLAEDAYGNLEPDYSGPITLALGANPAGGSIVGMLTANASAGAASFSGLTIAQAGLGYTLKATGSGGLSGVGSAFNVTNDQLIFTSQPSGSVTANSPFSLTVAAENASGVVDKNFIGSVTISAPFLGQDVLGTTTVQAVNGVATFTGLTLAQAFSASGMFTAQSADLPAAQSNTIVVNPAAVAKLVVVAQPPSNVTIGAPFQVQVAAEDAQGNVVTSFGGNTTLELGSHSGSTSLGGTTSVTAAQGVATFSGLTLNQVGSGDTLMAGGSGLAAALTSAIDVSPAGVATQLVVTTQPPSSVSAGNPFGLVAKAEDSLGTVISSFHGAVTISDPSGASLGGTTTVSAVGGVASFAGLSLTQAGSSVVLSLSSPGLVTASTSPFAVDARPATQIAVSAPDGNTLANVPFGTFVFAEDHYGNVDPNFNGNVSLALSGNPSGASLGGPLSATATDGSAFISGLSISKAGSGYVLSAQSAGLTPAPSAPFDTDSDQLTITTQPTISSTSGLGYKLTVEALNASGSVDSAFNGQVTASLVDLLNTGGTLGGDVTATARNGVATFSSLTINKSGEYELAIMSNGLGGVETTPVSVTTSLPAATTLTLRADHPAGAVYGQRVTFTATVQSTGGTPSGSVQFLVDGKNFGAPVVLVNGAATMKESSLHAAAHRVDANYIPSDPSMNQASRATTPASLRVTPAALTIIATSETIASGSPIPTLAARYIGFVNSDGVSSLKTPARLSTTATASSPAGSYPIIVGGATSSDYAINFVNGTLKVTPSQSTLPTGPVAQARAEFVTTLYEEILGRNPEPAGLVFWVNVLGRRVPQWRVALDLWRSSEHRALLAEHAAPRVPFNAALRDAVYREKLTLKLATPRPTVALALSTRGHI